jgi:hypothetical protein
LQLYPSALCVFQQLSISPPDIEPIMPTLPLATSVLQLRPERGRFAYMTSPPTEALVTTYRYGPRRSSAPAPTTGAARHSRRRRPPLFKPSPAAARS